MLRKDTLSKYIKSRSKYRLKLGGSGKIELPTIENYDSDTLNPKDFSPEHHDMEMKMRELHSSSPVGKSSIITFTPHSHWKDYESSVSWSKLRKMKIREKWAFHTEFPEIWEVQRFQNSSQRKTNIFRFESKFSSIEAHEDISKLFQANQKI